MVFYDLQLDSFFGCGRGGLAPGIALINKREFYFFIHHGLNGLGQLADLRSVLLVRWGDMKRQQMSQSVHGNMDL